MKKAHCLISIRVESGQVSRPISAFATCKRSPDLQTLRCEADLPEAGAAMAGVVIERRTGLPSCLSLKVSCPAFSGQGISVNSRGFLPVQVLVHDFLRSPVTESRVETGPIIAELDPPRDVFLCFLPGRVCGAVDQLDFQRAVHAFRQRIVIALTGQYCCSYLLAG
jgi:hypothetical protein